MPISQDSIQLWIVRVAGQAMERWRPVLSASEWERAMRFRMPADQARFAVTRGVLRTLLGRYLQMPGRPLHSVPTNMASPRRMEKSSSMWRTPAIMLCWRLPEK